ncbi:MAG: DNA-binding domain-containing protein [Pseudomonadota bacterium]
MSALAEQQQALLRALWQPRPEDALEAIAPHVPDAADPLLLRGLRAYRSNGRELASRALAGAYPVTAQLLGRENFEALAASLWLRYPPLRGDIAQWGAELAPHIESLADLAAEEPYLSDVARLEWALHAAATAADAERDTASFALLMEHDPAQLRLRLCPGAACIDSGWPVASIVLAHLQGEPSLEQAGARLRAGIAESALVWRDGLRPRLRLLEPAESLFIASLLQGRSLDAALQTAPQPDFNAWLAAAVQSGLVLGAGTTNPSTPAKDTP